MLPFLGGRLLYNLRMASPNKRSNLPDYTIVYSLYILAAVVPLAFVYQTYDIFELTKLTLLRVLTLVMAGAWVWTIYRDRAVRIARTPLDWFIAVYLGIMTLATVLSPSPRIALFGDYGRFEGLLTLLNYGAIFFLTGTLVRSNRLIPDTRAFARNLAMAAIGGGALVSVYGIFQRFGLDFLVWSSNGTDTTRSFSTLGNPIYVAAYATILLSLALALFVVERDTPRRVFLGAASVLIATCLVMTYSRAGWAGMLVSAGVLVTLFWLGRKSLLPFMAAKRLLAYIGLVLVVLAVIAGAVTLSERHASVPTKSALSRALSSFNLSSAGLADRASLWKSGIAMVKDRPVLGWGPDTFGTYYSQYRRLDMVRFERVTMNLSRPLHQNRVHSDILQQAISGGLVGAAAYVAMIGAFFLMALMSLRRARDNPYSALLIGIIAGLAGYFVQIQASFSTISSSPLVWMLMAAVFVIGDHPAEIATAKNRSRKDRTLLFGGGARAATREPNFLMRSLRLDYSKSNVYPRIAFGIILIVLALLIALSVVPLAADFYFNQGVTALGTTDLAGAKAAFDRALVLNPWVGDYADYAAAGFVDLARVSRDGGTAAGYLTTGIDYADRAIALNPAMPNYHYNRGNAEYYYSELPGLDQPTVRLDAQAALDDFRFAVAHDPYIADYHFNLASAYMRFSRKSAALAELKTGLRIDPTRKDARLWLKNVQK